MLLYLLTYGVTPPRGGGLNPRQKGHSRLTGPTISQVITHQGENWFAVNLIVKKSELAEGISELRSIGGSGVVVTPVNFIFEEEPEAFRKMLEELGVTNG